MTIKIYSDSQNDLGSDLEFFILNDGRICISHEVFDGEIHDFFLTQNEFTRIYNFINESIQANNE